MTRVALAVLLVAGSSGAGAELPPGAVARLGDARFRAGGPVRHLVLSPDGTHFATATDTELTTWDAATGRPVRARDLAAPVAGLAWAGGAPRAAEPARGSVAVALAGTRGAELVRTPRDRYEVRFFDLNPDAGSDPPRPLDLGAEAADELRLSADGSALLVLRRARPDGWTATAWDVATGRPQRPVPVPAAARPVLTPNATGLVLPAAPGGGARGFDLFALATAERVPLVRWPAGPAPSGEPGPAAFAPNGRVLAVAGGARAHLFDITTGTELGRLEGHAADVTAVAWAADGARVATADAAGLVRFWDAATLRPCEPVLGHTAPVEGADLSPNGRLVLTWAGDRTARVWDAATGRELRAFGDLSAGGPRPAFAADGTALRYTGPRGPLARDIQTGLELAHEVGPSAPAGPVSAAFGAGARAAGGTVELVERASGEVRRVLRGHRGAARVLGFTPDGTRLLTAGGDHTVLVWDVRPQAVPLPDELKAETSAAKLWDALGGARADGAYLALARLARDPGAAAKLARQRLRPVPEPRAETDSANRADARAIELLAALGTPEARALLEELARGEPTAFRTREAARALARPAP